MVAATLCGITDPRKVKRSICAMGHKWLWNRDARRPAAGRVSGQGRSFVCRRSRETRRRVRHLRPDRRHACRRTGPRNSGSSPAFPFRSAHSMPTGTLSARVPHRRHGQRGRHLHVHHRHYALGESGSGCLRRGAGQRASASHRHRSWPLCGRRHLQRYRHACRYRRSDAEPGLENIAPAKPACCA